MRERWMPVLGYEDCYEVSDEGRVRRSDNFGSTSKGLLSPRPKSGYITFHLCRNGVRKDALAHRLVWQAFNRPLNRNEEINHLNGDKADNRLTNLDACSASQNMLHSFRVLKHPPANNPNYGSKNGSAKLTEAEVADILALYATGEYRQKDLGKRFGVSQRMISLITRREKWQHVKAATLKDTSLPLRQKIL